MARRARAAVDRLGRGAGGRRGRVAACSRRAVRWRRTPSRSPGARRSKTIRRPRDVAGSRASPARPGTWSARGGQGGDSWRAWSGMRRRTRCLRALGASATARRSTRRGASDLATVPDRVAPVAVAWSGRSIVFAGFLALTPQQHRLSEALRDARRRVIELQAIGDDAASPVGGDLRQRPATSGARPSPGRVRAWNAIPRRESRIVVPGPRAAAGRGARLRDRRPRRGRERGPGVEPVARSALGDVPRVAAALDLAALAWTALPVGRAAALLRSEALPGRKR